MNRSLFIFAVLIFFSCRSKETNAAVAVPDKGVSARVDTVRREKFTLPIQYDKFDGATFTGKQASINYSSNKGARRFRSLIGSSIEKFGMNFAGHYNLAKWGCGTACINGAITDLKTGNIYDLPLGSLDYGFRNDSRLVVVNPPDSAGYYDYCIYCTPELWVWDDKRKKFEKPN